MKAHETGLYRMSELCAAFEISRKTGYKWLNRFQAGGFAGLEDHSSAPLHSPQRMKAEIEALLLEKRKVRPHWGPRKILKVLSVTHPELASDLPAASTVGDLYRRNGLVARRKRRAPAAVEPAGALQTDAPNDVWTADFKGEFRLGNRQYCYPFTLADAHTRYLLACRGEASTATQGVRGALIEAFRTYGLPRAIRTDNGTPFVGHGRSGLSQLSVWWIQLGIVHQRIPKGRPDQNGRHERMHRTLKAEATRPPEHSFEKQQRRFDEFRSDFNQVRPHEALDQHTPASCYHRSPRAFPDAVASPEYPGHFELRKIDNKGTLQFQGHRFFIAEPLAGEWLGLVEMDDDLWSIRFHNYELGRVNPRNRVFTIKVLPMSPV